MAYLWASAVVALGPWPRKTSALGPVAVSLLADTVTAHLAARERFTVYFDWRRWNLPYPRSLCAARALQGSHDLVRAVHQRADQSAFTVRETSRGRYSHILQFLPHDEWHPAPAADPGPPETVLCDASYTSPDLVRGGLVTAAGSVSVDLGDAHLHDSDQAEFLTLCLALLTSAGSRSPLTVHTDSQVAVEETGLLPEGRIPPWLYRGGNDLALRIAIAAMTSIRLRPVRIERRSRATVAAAHDTASVRVPNHHLVQPRNWARTHGLPLSWHDAQRGLDHHS